MSLSDDQVRRIARLARIAVRPTRPPRCVERLNRRARRWSTQMRAVDTAGRRADGARAGRRRSALREDAVTEADRREAYQAVAPAVEDGLYLVPKVIE